MVMPLPKVRSRRGRPRKAAPMSLYNGVKQRRAGFYGQRRRLIIVTTIAHGIIEITLFSRSLRVI